VEQFQTIVIGGGHAGVEAAWAAANMLGEPRSVALVTIDPSKIGVMSCNPAIGGLAKGQLVREIDALGGVMGMATDATGIQFKMLNTSKGPAVYGPRAQCDKHAYAEAVQRLIASRGEIVVVSGTVDRLLVNGDRVRGVVLHDGRELAARAVVLTTGTFMRGLMHTGEQKTAGGRFGEASAEGISGMLRELGFELGRLKTGTPPRLKRSSIQWAELPPQQGDETPIPFSDLTDRDARHLQQPEWSSLDGGDEALRANHTTTTRLLDAWAADGFVGAFPLLKQVECRQTGTNAAAHEAIRANLHRAPMYSGQIESVGPRYCPSIEDKVVRFAERGEHGVFLEPESLRDDWVYCNGVSTSLPADVQDIIVRSMPGCERAEILRYGYAVEYDMVRPHQILPTGMTRLVQGLFLAGQINGTSGYEEAGAQGLVAGANAALHVTGKSEWVIGRDEAYIGVMMDDLVCKTPVEPYRMFTSRAEHRLLLRADNAAERLGETAKRLGLWGQHAFGARRDAMTRERAAQIATLNAAIDRAKVESEPLARLIVRSEYTLANMREHLSGDASLAGIATATWDTVWADRRYEPFVVRQRNEIKRQAEMETRRIPDHMDFGAIDGLRTEAKASLTKFRPRTFGQALRLEGITPADVTLLAVHAKRFADSRE
jgi:tRNA uridine 5-carboxymethylaminomethyl modification enzyme